MQRNLIQAGRRKKALTNKKRLGEAVPPCNRGAVTGTNSVTFMGIFLPQSASPSVSKPRVRAGDVL